MATSTQTQINRLVTALLIIASEIEATDPQLKGLTDTIQLTIKPKRKPKGIKG